MVRTRTCLLLLILSPVCSAAGQDQRSADTAATQRIILIDPGISLGRPVFLLPPALDDGDIVPFPFLPLRETGPLIPFVAGPAPPAADLLLPLKLERERQARLAPYMTILGAMSAGGAAYVAYLHIRRYGFLK